MKPSVCSIGGWIIVVVLFAGCQHANQGSRRQAREVGELREEVGTSPGRVRTYYRGEHEVLTEYVLSGGRRVRIFSQAGRPVVSESDEDGDGILETITLFPDNPLEGEVFKRTPEGAVTPLSSEDLGRLHLRIAEALQAFRRAQEPRSRR